MDGSFHYLIMWGTRSPTPPALAALVPVTQIREARLRAVKLFPSAPAFCLFCPLMAGKQSLITGRGGQGTEKGREMPHPICFITCPMEAVRHYLFPSTLNWGTSALRQCRLASCQGPPPTPTPAPSSARLPWTTQERHSWDSRNLGPPSWNPESQHSKA